MADRYKLPDALGGGEYEEHRRADGSTEAPTGTVAFLENGCLFTVARVLLTKVEPPLPAEPPNRSVVTVLDAIGKLNVFERDDDSMVRWWPAGSNLSWDWPRICQLGTPRRLVPEEPAEPVTLPWKVTPCRASVSVILLDTGRVNIVADNGDGKTVVVTVDPTDALAMAAALLAASRAES